jgi:hypothetical protein
MVLDSTVNPGRVWYQSNLDQNIPFYENLEVFLAWVAKYQGTGGGVGAVSRTRPARSGRRP